MVKRNQIKMYKKLNILIIILFLSSCGTLKEGFVNSKKENSDEFLVEKKNPLVMPPEYRSLPEPENIQNLEKKNNEDDFEKIISNTKTETTKNKIKNSNIEKSVLEKIK